MAENAYMMRLNQLKEQKVESAEKRMAPILGRPLTRQAPGPVVDPRGPQEAPQEEQAPDMTSMFGRNIERFTGEDNRFGEMFQEFTKLAEGLRQQVDQGYMPKPIAEQRLKSYIRDSQNYFSQNKPGLMNNPTFRQGVEGLMEQAMAGQGAEQMPPQEGQMPPQEQIPQGGM